MNFGGVLERVREGPGEKRMSDDARAGRVGDSGATSHPAWPSWSSADARLAKLFLYICRACGTGRPGRRPLAHPSPRLQMQHG